MADTNNYGLLNNITQGIREGMIQYQTVRNQNRQNQLYNLAHGIQEGENGLELTPEMQQQKQAERGLLQSKYAESQRALREEDPTSKESTALRDFISAQTGKDVPSNVSGAQLKGAYGLMGTGMKTEQMAAALGARQANQDRSFELRNDSMVLKNHGQALKSITEDKQLSPLLQSYQNLENAKQNFMKGGATPQEFSELQQAVRSNAGIKGTSGVGERTETYLHSLGINKDKFMQFVTGDPQSVIKSDPEFAKQILGLVELEQENKKKQAVAQIDKKATGFKTFYNRPGMDDYRQDFQNTIDQFKSQFDLGEKSGVEHGKVSDSIPSNRGLLSKTASALGLSNASAPSGHQEAANAEAESQARQKRIAELRAKKQQNVAGGAR